jgi:hypothetical protein
LLNEDLEVQLTQTVDEEGAGKALIVPLLFLSCALAALHGLDSLKLFFSNWGCYAVCFGLGYLTYHIKDAVACFLVSLSGFCIISKGNC